MSKASARAAALFSALGDETRLALVERLGRGEPLSITQLTAGTTVTRQGVTKHLRVLEGAGLVRSVRHGREALYVLEGGPVGEARALLDTVSAGWDRALGRLEAMLEAEARPTPRGAPLTPRRAATPSPARRGGRSGARRRGPR